MQCQSNENEQSNSPPAYKDLSRSANEIFDLGYLGGIYMVDVKTCTTSGIDFHVYGQKDINTGLTLASIQTKFDYPDQGLTFIKRWVTTNQLYGKFMARTAKGIDFSGEIAFNPYTGNKSGFFETIWKKESFNIAADLAVDTCRRWLINAGGVGSLCKNFVAGLHLSFDYWNRKILHSSMACGYISDNFSLTTQVDDGLFFSSSMYQKINPTTDYGFHLSFNRVLNSSYAAFGSIWKPSGCQTVRTKVDTNRNIGISVCHKFRPEIKLTFSAIFSLTNTSNMANNLGFAIMFQV